MAFITQFMNFVERFNFLDMLLQSFPFPELSWKVVTEWEFSILKQTVRVKLSNLYFHDLGLE